MKNFSPGLSDSIASVIADPAQCPQCNSSSRIGGGLCVGCLLQAGLEPDDECAPETLVSALAEITLQDKNWRLGNYEILEEIGRGGMGVIYRARQRHSRRIVAVKRVLGYHADSRETLARFRREAQAAASLDHPNILPIYEVSESEDGLPFFSMKFAPGGNLQEVGPALRNEPRQCVALMAKVARAVQYAHGKGILHRDLKPGNILLDGRGEPLVSDFGLAKWLDTTSDLTRTLTIFGTPGYIAPEQASGPAAQLKPAADVYSLGAILFDLLAGRPPFLGSHALSVIRQASETSAPKLRSFSKVADRDLETICARCLEREPSARYCSAHDLAADLERWLEGRPIKARRVLPPTRVWRWSRRNPAMALAGCIVALLIAITLATQVQRTRLSRLVQRDAISQHSIGLLPALDLDRGSLEPGIVQEISDALQLKMNQFGPARVVPITSKEGSALVANSDPVTIASIARTMNVRAMLMVTKRARAGKLRYSVRLVDGSSGEIVLRRIFEIDSATSSANGLSALIGNLAYSVLNSADLSKHKLSNNDPGLQNERTKELILAGKTLQDRRTATDIDRALECFKKAAAIEPGSALAYSLLALTQAGRVMIEADPTYLSFAEQSANTALRLNPELGEAHRARATILLLRGVFHDAIDELFTAYELGDAEPRTANLAARIQRTLGRPDEALAWYGIAAQGQIRPGQNDFVIGDCWADLADDAQAANAYSRASELFPYLPEGWMGLCRLALLKKDFVSARTICSENWTRYRDFVFSQEMAAQVEFFSRNFQEAETLYQELAAKDANGGGSFYGCISYNSAIGRLRLAAGDDRGGKAILQAALEQEKKALQSAPHHPEILYRIAAIESSLGEIESAMSDLDAAAHAGWIDYRSLALDPRFDALRNDPSYKPIFGSMVTQVASLRRSMAAEKVAQITK
jgi:serine/threonine protein kinase/tetratricopeptide (TPR) repeat protein